MTDHDDLETPESIADRMDDALAAFWNGSSTELDKLVETTADGSGPSIGQLFPVFGELEPGGGDRPAVSNFEIIRELGRGGMGVVFEAQQRNPQRRVALKVVRGLHRLDVHHIKLFQREIQTLARLRHSGIAAIHEAGRTEDGNHYFAMDLVEGCSLTDFFRSGESKPGSDPLDTPNRLRLFREVCDAVQYAHQRGVIHRDLKPSNIIVDDQGHPRILDFGLARITESDVTLATTVAETGKIMGTLPYMSPEQARGKPDDIDVRSDVYSLGVVLYELLTDELPYDVGRVMLPEAVRIICEESPRRPSTISRALRGDLDTIVLKALDKDPARRYQSAAALADDVERYATGQPILARPPSAMYQMRKLVARHRLSAALVALLFLSITAFAVVSTVQARQLATERDNALAAQHNETEARKKAESESEKAEAISQFFQDMLVSADPYEDGKGTTTVREVLDEAAGRIENEWETQDDVRATLQRAIGNTYRSLGLFEKAERHLQAALKMQKTLFGREHLDVAGTMMDLGSALADAGDLEQGETLCREALDIQRALVENEDVAVAAALSALCTILGKRGDYEGAEALCRESLAISRKLYGEEHRHVASVLGNLAALAAYRGRFSEAELLARQALEIDQELFEPNHPLIGEDLQLLGVIRLELNKLKEAREPLEKALEIQRERLGPEHPAIADSLNNLAALHVDLGNDVTAEAMHRESLAMRRKLFGDHHPAVSNSLNNLGMLLYRAGDLQAAEETLRKALQIRRDTLGTQHPRVANTLSNLGQVLDARWSDEAEGVYREVLAILQGHFGPTQPRTLGAKQNLAINLLQHKRKLAEAESLVRELLDVLREDSPETDNQVPYMLALLGDIIITAGDPERAEPFIDESLEMRRKAITEGYGTVGTIESMLGESLTALRRFEEAESLLLESYQVAVDDYGDTDTETLESLQCIIDLYEVWNKPELATKYRAMMPVPEGDEAQEEAVPNGNGDSTGD